jgi:hypothetical protein
VWSLNLRTGGAAKTVPVFGATNTFNAFCLRFGIRFESVNPEVLKFRNRGKVPFVLSNETHAFFKGCTLRLSLAPAGIEKSAALAGFDPNAASKRAVQ